MENQFNMEDSRHIAKTQIQLNQFDQESRLQRSISYMESEPQHTPVYQKNNVYYQASSSSKFKPNIQNIKQPSESSEDEPENIIIKNRNVSEEQNIEMKVVQKNLKEIFDYYSQSYLQPTKKYETFDAVKNRYLKFQSFVLFLKDFNILKTIFSLNKVKILFKKYAKYGKHMDFQNFFQVVKAMPHQNQPKEVFNNVYNYGKYKKQLKTLDDQVHAELERQTFFNYMDLMQPKQYRKKYSQIFKPFLCDEDAQLPKIKYHYRKFSMQQLQKKAIPQQKNDKEKDKKRQFIVLKSKEKPVVNQSIFNQTKPMVVSWQLFRSKSLGNIQRSFQKVRRKIIHQSQEDDMYLQKFRLHNDKKLIKNMSESPIKQGSSLKNIQKKIQQIQKMQQKKDQQILDRIDNKMKKRKLIL